MLFNLRAIAHVGVRLRTKRNAAILTPRHACCLQPAARPAVGDEDELDPLQDHHGDGSPVPAPRGARPRPPRPGTGGHRFSSLSRRHVSSWGLRLAWGLAKGLGPAVPIQARNVRPHSARREQEIRE